MTSYRGHAAAQFATGSADHQAFFASIHHKNPAQGRALRALRAQRPQCQQGTVVLLGPVEPASGSPQDTEAAVGTKFSVPKAFKGR